MAHPKLIAIVNPAAKGGSVGDRLMAIRQALAGEFASGVYQTLRRGQAMEWARTFRDRPGYLVLGGDGTLHEVLAGMDTAAQSLALVPVGTGNSLGRDLGLPDLAAVLDAVAADRTVKIDVIRAVFRDELGVTQVRVVGATLALGYPARVTAYAEEWFKALGPLCYPVAAAVAAVGIPSFTASVRLNGARARRRRMTGLLVNNARHAGNFAAFPDASLVDGEFDVMELDAGFVRQTLHNLAVLTRTYWIKPASQGRARRLSVKPARPVPLMIDGEMYPDVTSLDLTIQPRRLALFVPHGVELV